MTNSSPTRSSRLDRLVDEAIARHGLIEQGDSVLVAVSGGADSTALLHLLAARAPAWQLRLGLAHVDHGLRLESSQDLRFVRQLAEAFGVILHAERIEVRALQRQWRLSLEEAGRKARYQFFQETADRHGYGRVALAHHGDDNAETLLLNLLRGSGRRGLRGITPLRADRYIRPMIRATRADIEDYLRRHGLSALRDPTNADRLFLRNRIRHQLIPLLERDFQPKARAVLRRTAEILGEEEDWLDSLIETLLQPVLISRQADRLMLRTDALRELPPAAQRRVLRAALRLIQENLQRISFGHIERIRDLACGRTAPGPLHLPADIRVLRRADHLLMIRDNAGQAQEPQGTTFGDYVYEMPGCGVLVIAETGDCIALSEIQRDEAADPSAAGPLSAFLDGAAVEFPVTVRNFRSGDRFSPLGAGGTQKLKKFFIDHQVPREERRRFPLLISRGRILWVGGHRIDQHARLSPLTRRVMKAELILADSKKMHNIKYKA
jgi:tRNA(Ile)-lysidine synthase